MGQGAKVNGVKNCRYQYDWWVDADGRLYLKCTAIEFERATETTFALAAKRKIRTILESFGLEPTWANGIGGVEVWDIARDWASSMPEAYTFRTARALPDEVLAGAAAA